MIDLKGKAKNSTSGSIFKDLLELHRKLWPQPEVAIKAPGPGQI